MKPPSAYEAMPRHGLPLETKEAGKLFTRPLTWLERLGFNGLRSRLAITVLLAILPALVVMYLAHISWLGFLVGALALMAAWFGGEHFILRHLRALHSASQRLALGDLSTRSGLPHESGELGELARTFDDMAEALEKRAQEQERTSHTLLSRALQQTVVASIGQFALVANDLASLFNQAAMLCAQTLESEMCGVFELDEATERLVLLDGVGWRRGSFGSASVPASPDGECGLALSNGEPLVFSNLRYDGRFLPSPLLLNHGVVGGVCVQIATRGKAFGVLSVYTSRRRQFTGDEVHFLLAVATALGMAVDRHHADAERHKLAMFTQLNPNPAMEITADGAITYFNDAALQLALTIEKSHPRDILPPETGEIVQECLNQKRSWTRFESKLERRTLSWSFHPVSDTNVVHVYIEDITDRLNLEAQLFQAQKMESIGQLAAGVAHDFNNLLTIMQGHAGLLLARPNPTREITDSAQAIYFASERAASLTRQLLMFSRKNVMQVKPLDLRDVVTQLQKMLKRLISEPVRHEFNPPAELPLINADAGMLEQVIVNLAVNARDAMPRGGTLELSLTPVEVTESSLTDHPEGRPGQFVCLRVADNGCGMDEATLARIFEPFFTTKEVGKGTGLGLATVYGIVKQHEGWVEVASEVGVGTVFSVFFPVSESSEATAEFATDPNAFVRGGTETVLVVEDEPVLREMAKLILEEYGYRVLAACSGPEAVEVWNLAKGKIHVVLTDMVMPEGVSGVELAEQLLRENPFVKVIFTSGYTMDDISTDFLRKHNHACFLQKPYTRTALARTLRRSLDGQKPVVDSGALQPA